MSLLKEFAGVPVTQAPDLKKSDSSDAGKNDVVDKARKNDVSFSLMRNTINADGEVTGSDVADYLERAAELNDEVDTVPFGLETDDGDIVKVYVNAEQADKFEEAMKKLLGIEDDIEEAINQLAQEFDIVDVVWPKDKEESDDEGLDVSSEYDPLTDEEDEEMVEVARYDPLPESLEEQTETLEEEIPAFEKLEAIVANLQTMGSAGVAMMTGLDSKTNTKHEMISKFIQTKYAKEAQEVRDWFARVAPTDNQPFWLS